MSYHEKYYGEEPKYVINEKSMEFFFDANAIFCRYSYFTKQLWRKVKGFKKEDEAEIKCAFLSVWMKNQMGIVTYPVGSGWCTMNGNIDSFNEYVKKFQPVFDDYQKWYNLQR
ncbi:MAG: hypothetical protein [Wendovervirus sonii]|uniref:DUF3841 domain-containing protein n=1 Tax=phage Lak_Megaphage_Sonny TaxID=3109229 RepID=A0ABZ0Z6X5_9CAUD|nr:MAG: hypothetical protein [phage Lak_Megaphage_Sonny]